VTRAPTACHRCGLPSVRDGLCLDCEDVLRYLGERLLWSDAARPSQADLFWRRDLSTYSPTRCNLAGCCNLLPPHRRGPRRLYCCRLHGDRAARAPKPLRFIPATTPEP